METNNNPYSTPQTTDSTVSPPAHRSHNRVRWIIYAVIALGISAVPIYGYFAHAARDYQNTVLWIMLAWLVTLINTLILFVRSVILAKTDRFGAMIFVAISLILACMLFFGFYGIGGAVVELWAG